MAIGFPMVKNFPSSSLPAGAKIYGFSVDSSNSNPSTAVSYQIRYKGRRVDNYSYFPAYMDFTNDTWEWGDWDDEDFFIPRPCLISQNYQSKIYLDPNDNTKDANGNDVTSYLTGASGSYNAMMEWGRDGKQIWYKLVPGIDSGRTYTVYISNMQLDSDFHAWSFYDQSDNIVDHFYTSIYEATNDNNTLRSLSGKTPCACVSGVTGLSLFTYAKANNKNYETFAWYINIFADRILINLLLTLLIKSLNSSEKVGIGNISGRASGVKISGLGNNKGLFWGTNSSGNIVKCFGIENYWGNLWQKNAGLGSDGTTLVYKLTYGTADGSSASGYIESDDAPTNYLTGPSLQGGENKYITKEIAYDNGGLLVSSVTGGGNNMYYSDSSHIAMGVYGAMDGGYCNFTGCGAWTIRVYSKVSATGWDFGVGLSLRIPKAL